MDLLYLFKQLRDVNFKSQTVPVIGFLLFAFTIIFPVFANSAVGATSDSSLQLQPSQLKYNVAPYLSYLEDPTGKLTIHDIRKEAIQAEFKPIKDALFRHPESESYFWLKLNLINHSSSKLLFNNWILEVGSPRLPYVDFYVLSKYNLLFEFSGGDFFPFEHRYIKHNNHIIPLTLHAGQEVNVYIRVWSYAPIVMPINLWDQTHFTENENNEAIFNGMFYGIFGLILLYNFFVFLSTRDRSFLYYNCMAGGSMLCLASLDGNAYHYLWPNFSSWNSLSASIFTPISSIGSMLLANNFLNLQQKHPRMYLFNIMLMVINGIMAITYFFISLRIITPMVAYMALFMVVYNLLLAIRLAFDGGRNNLFFLLSWCFPFLSTVIYVLAELAILPQLDIIRHAVKFGMAAQGFVFTYALTDRINLIRRENTVLQKNALKSSQESNQLKDQFLSTISHEFRTPMNGVMGAVQLLRDETLSERGKELLNIADDASRHMLSLIKSILDFVELESGRIRLKKEKIQWEEKWPQLFKVYENQCKSKGLEIKIDFKSLEGKTFFADFDKLNYIIDCLIGNAIKFTDHGTISIKGSLASAEDPTFSLLTLSVTDTGIGIEENKSEEIFDVLKQIDGSFSRRFGGLGIGLALSKRLAVLMGGDITYDSQVGKGSCFQFKIRVYNEEMETPANEEPTDISKLQFGKPLEHYHVLVVDDNPVNLKVLTKMVEQMGYTTLTAPNGAEAIKIALENPVDLILMDCQMPVMDGFEATLKIRTLNDQYAHIPIIAVTANVTEEDRQRCFDVGMDDFIGKPFKRETIAEIMKRQLLHIAS